jgi:hypothetical protein
MLLLWVVFVSCTPRTQPQRLKPALPFCASSQSDWRLRRATVERFLEAVQDKYRDNPYHNATHAADVTQTAGVIMRALDAFLRTPPSGSSNSSNSSSAAAGGAGGSSSGSGSSSSSSSTGPPAGPEGDGCRAGLSRLERFAIILAAAVHDLGHPGVNNAFLVKTRAPMALTYNDRSVNENMHACLAFSLAQQPGLNIFEGFSDAEYEQVGKGTGCEAEGSCWCCCVHAAAAGATLHV